MTRGEVAKYLSSDASGADARQRLADRIVSREATRTRKRPFAREPAELVRHAVGYHARPIEHFLSAPRTTH